MKDLLENARYHNMTKLASNNRDGLGTSLAIGGGIGAMTMIPATASNWGRYINQGINTSMGNSMYNRALKAARPGATYSQIERGLNRVNPNLFGFNRAPGNVGGFSPQLRQDMTPGIRNSLFGRYKGKGFFSFGDDAIHATRNVRPSMWNRVAGTTRGVGKGLAHIGLGIGAGAALMGGAYLWNKYRNRS